MQEVPESRIMFDAELQELLSSTQWQQNPNDELFIKVKNMMILNIINGNREKGLLEAIKADAKDLNSLLVENCN